MSINLSSLLGPSPDDEAQSFLPTEYVRGKNEHRANVMALLLLGVVTSGTIGAFMVTNRRWESIRREQRVIAAQFEDEKAKIEQLKSIEAQRLEMVEKAEVVNALIDRVPRSVLLAELSRDLPAKLTLTDIKLQGSRVKPPPPKPDPKRDGAASKRGSLSRKKGKADAEPVVEKVPPPQFEHTVLVQGRAKMNNDVADYFSRLRASPLFEEAELVSIEESKGGDGMERTFTVRLKIGAEADARLVAGVEETELVREDAGETLAEVGGTED